MTDIKVRNENLILDVRIDGLLHLFIELKDIKALHSYIDKFPGGYTKITDTSGVVTSSCEMYYIHFYLASGQIIKTKYYNRELWEQILKGL